MWAARIYICLHVGIEHHWGQFLKKILSPLVILSMEKTMVTMVISELKSISRLKIFRETEPWDLEMLVTDGRRMRLAQINT